MVTLICQHCFHLASRLDFAGDPHWLEFEKLIALPAPDGLAINREQFRCTSMNCGRRWARISKASKPGIVEWVALGY